MSPNKLKPVAPKPTEPKPKMTERNQNEPEPVAPKPTDPELVELKEANLSDVSPNKLKPVAPKPTEPKPKMTERNQNEPEPVAPKPTDTKPIKLDLTKLQPAERNPTELRKGRKRVVGTRREMSGEPLLPDDPGIAGVIMLLAACLHACMPGCCLPGRQAASATWRLEEARDAA